MKAAVLNKYDKKGTELVIKDLPIPTIKEDEILLKVKTAGVNPLDNMIIKKEVKMIVPYKLPQILGNEVVGTVEKVGSKVSDCKIGDRVYARMPLDSIGAFAEYVAIKSSSVAPVPEYLSDVDAASVPLTALTALQAFELMNVKKGDTIFISGGSGGLGAMAIPIAKSFGLTVITNGNGESEERVRKLGADVYIDYRKEDYAKTVKDVDYVLDTLGDKELPKEFAILKDGGELVSLRGLPNGEFAKRFGLPLYKRVLLKIAGGKYDRLAKKKNQKYHFIFVKESGEGLKRINEIFKDKHIETSVGEVFSLSDINVALEKVKKGQVKGKAIIKVSD